MEINKIKSKKFVTNAIAIYLTTKLDKETITMNALIPEILKRGTENYKTQLDISKKLEDMYGAVFNFSREKVGNFFVMKFYISTLENRYLPEEKNLAQEGINLLADIVFNPLKEDGVFNAKYVEQEKENRKKEIESRKDDKDAYAYSRALEELMGDDPYGSFIYGDIEHLEKIDNKNLYEYYQKLLKECKIDVFVDGFDVDEITLPEIMKEYGNTEFKQLSDEVKNKLLNVVQEPKKVIDKLDVTQGKIDIGLRVSDEDKYAILVYNQILGGDANSKLFQNVREKNGLAYTVRSTYLKYNNFIMIRTGIQLENFDKCLKVIEEQLADLQNGKITEKEITDAKECIFAALREIDESQLATINFEFSKLTLADGDSVEDKEKKIRDVTIDDVIRVAKGVSVNLVYYLTNEK
jgi:predicted Zn-dependent peptidase